MKFVYITLVLILIGSGYFFVQSQKKADEATINEAINEVPDGFHKMEDGTIMNNNGNVEIKNIQEKESTSSPAINIKPTQANVTIDPNSRVFTVKGINHSYNLKEIKVKKGDTVTINFVSTDGFHDWVIDEFAAATKKVQPGVPTSVTFVADESGSFEFYCSVGNHRAQGMIGNLVVEE